MSYLKIFAAVIYMLSSLDCSADESKKIPKDEYLLSIQSPWEYPPKEVGLNTRTASAKIIYFESSGKYFELTGIVTDNADQTTPYYFSDGGGYISATGVWSFNGSEFSIFINSISRGISTVSSGVDPLCKTSKAQYELTPKGLYDYKGNVYLHTDKLVDDNLRSYFTGAEKSKLRCQKDKQ